MKKKLSLAEYVLLMIILIFGFYKAYSLHADNPYPVHHDEWQHLGIVMQTMEFGYISEKNPNLVKAEPFHDLERGFHIFLADFFLLTNLEPVHGYQYLAALFVIISGLAIFICIYELTKNYYMSIISLLMFVLLKSNVNILGIDYFIPLTMAIPFMFFFILQYINSIETQNQANLATSVILLLFLFFMHPPSMVILLIPSLIQFLNCKSVFKKKLISSKLFIIIGIIAVLAILSLFWTESFQVTREVILDMIVFEQGWGKLEVTYFLPLLYGILPTLLAVYGFLNLSSSASSLKLGFFSSFAVLAVALTGFFNVFGFSILVPYSRLVYYSMLAMIPLTAIGLQHVTDRVEFVKNRSHQKIILTIILIISISLSTYELDMRYKKYSQTILTDADYDALIWFSSNIGKDKIVLTPFFTTSAVYPVSHNFVISLVAAVLEGGHAQENLEFFQYDCEQMKNVTDSSGAEFIISRSKLECSYFSEIYSNADFIYKVI
ncbi:MAG: hypothetical protein ABIJ34_03760 [archaeon]